MPRRNQRERYEPLDMTPPEPVRHPFAPPPRPIAPGERVKSRAEIEAERSERQRAARTKRDVNERVASRADAEEVERKRSRSAQGHGHIYFIRLNDLIKVGWTGDLWNRVKAYGASAQLLVAYPGTRDDETYLHRQLRPALAKGREWYEDGAVLAHFIDEALAKYGQPPSFDAMWTQPKRIVAGKRAARAR